MAKTKHAIARKIIDTFKGTLDFYPRGEETIIRTWPKNRGKSQTPRSLRWTAFFKCFHLYYSSSRTFPLEYFPSAAVGPSWSRRDYAMWLWYGKMPLPDYFVRDERTPWPPVCDDPLGRFFQVGNFHGTPRLFGGATIQYTRRPFGGNRVYMTHELPHYQRKWVIRRGDRCQVAPLIGPPDGLLTPFGGNAYDDPPYTNRFTYFDSLDHPVFWFLTGGGLGLYHYVSTSAWYWGYIRPGPAGGFLGAQYIGPQVLTPYQIDFLRDHPTGSI